MSRDLTAEEIAELSERVRAGNVAAIDTARKATKPKPASVPAVSAEPRLTGLKRDLARLSNLHAQIMTARRYISDLRTKSGARAMMLDPQASRHNLFLVNSESELHHLLESFLHSLRFHFHDRPATR